MGLSFLPALQHRAGRVGLNKNERATLGGTLALTVSVLVLGYAVGTAYVERSQVRVAPLSTERCPPQHLTVSVEIEPSQYAAICVPIERPVPPARAVRVAYDAPSDREVGMEAAASVDRERAAEINRG